MTHCVATCITCALFLDSTVLPWSSVLHKQRGSPCVLVLPSKPESASCALLQVQIVLLPYAQHGTPSEIHDNTTVYVVDHCPS